jgi:glutathione S-transferase
VRQNGSPLIREIHLEPNAIRLFADAQFASPYAMSVFVALSEKNLGFEIVTVNLAVSENQGADFASKSITRRVPTLQHGSFFLSESTAITEYLDETFPGTPLYPSDRQSRAKARQVQAWLRSDLMPLRQERSTEVVFYGTKAAPLSAGAQKAADKLIAVAEAWLPAGEEHLCGQWSVADVDLALMLQRLALHGDPLPKRWAAYAAHQWQRPSVQKWVQRERPLL